MTHYFITSEENPTPSAIEIAQMKRVKIFDYLHQKAKIIELNHNIWHDDAQQALASHDYVINMYQYYQKLPLKLKQNNDNDLIDKILGQDKLDRNGLIGYKNGKKRLHLVLRENRLYSANYYDQYGYLDQTDFYDDGCLSFSEFYEDKGRLIMRQYYNADSCVVIRMHYRGTSENKPALALINLYQNGCQYDFDSLDEFKAHFLDDLCLRDNNAVFYADRSDVALAAFDLMHAKNKRYMIFHSAITTDGASNGKIFEVYQDIGNMLKRGTLMGLICATNKEAKDAANRFNTRHSYGIPVTYTNSVKQVSFNKRNPYSLIAVARRDQVKQLDHIIRTVKKLHGDFPQLALNIYGYGDDKTKSDLEKLVANLNANTYVKFAGFKHDLTDVYNSAWLEVLTSKFEGFAMALLEAQEHGCPAVSYDINYGPSEIITNNVNGNLIQANDESALYEAIKNLLLHPEILQEYSGNAYKTCNKYAFDHVASIWQQFLEKEKLILKK